MPEVLMHHADWTRIKGILVRRTRFLSTHDITVVDGIVCTNLARTACDIAPDITDTQLVRVVDDIQRRGFSMGWVMYRADKLNRMGRPGPPLVLDAASTTSASSTPTAPNSNSSHDEHWVTLDAHGRRELPRATNQVGYSWRLSGLRR